MKAKVTHYNSKVGYYSALTENGIKAVFSLIDSPVLNLDDVLTGDIESRGMKTVLNETQGTQIRIDIGELHKIEGPFLGHSGESPKT